MSLSVDVCVLGAGAAGLSAARAAAGRGASVVLIERDRLGGECTWSGCVPSKALLSVAHDVAAARRVGAEVHVDGAAVLEGVRRRVATVAAEEDQPTLVAEGIAVVRGDGRLAEPGVVEVDGERVRARHVIVATGSEAARPGLDGLAGPGVVTNETLFTLTELPQRLGVLGGGAVGVEMAQAFARLGTRVTVLEMADRLVGPEEPDASAVVHRALVADGVDVRVGAAVDRVERAGALRLHAGDASEPVEVDVLLVATGRRPRTDGLGLEEVGVRVDRGGVVVDDRLRTTVEGVWAVGDVAGGAFTHSGDEMGRIAVANALGRVALRRWSDRAVPSVVYTDPEVGRVGLTEAQAVEEHGDGVRVAHFPLAETDRAKTAGVTDGFVQLVTAPHPVVRDALGGMLVGATVVGPTGGDVVHTLAHAVRVRSNVAHIVRTVHAYPSWALAVREAATICFGSHKGHTPRPGRAGGT